MDAPVSNVRSASRIAHGGKTVYGAAVGILILDTQYPRIPGDPVNAATWPFPVLYKVVRTATPGRVVMDRAKGLKEAFLDAAASLVADGADGLTTTCGFLALLQKDLAAHAGVPVAASSLMQVPHVQRLLPPRKRVGILTVSAPSLGPDHLAAAGADPSTPIAGTEQGSEFNRTMYEGLPEANIALCEADVLKAGLSLVQENENIGAVVVECTRMVPYSRALSETLGLPVFDIYDFVCWFQSGLRPRDFGHPGSGPRPWR